MHKYIHLKYMQHFIMAFVIAFVFECIHMQGCIIYYAVCFLHYAEVNSLQIFASLH